MCRMLYTKNLAWGKDQMRRLFDHMIKDSAGDGGGMWVPLEGDLNLIEKGALKHWNDPEWLSQKYLEMMAKSTTGEIAVHLRKTSSGATIDQNNHPMTITELYEMWTETDEGLELVTENGFFMHNGTMGKFAFKHVLMSLSVMLSLQQQHKKWQDRDFQPTTRDLLFSTDTQLLATAVGGMGPYILNIIKELDDFGTVITRVGTKIWFFRGNRDLYMLKWDDDSYIVSSTFEPLLVENEIEEHGATLIEVPKGGPRKISSILRRTEDQRNHISATRAKSKFRLTTYRNRKTTTTGGRQGANRKKGSKKKSTKPKQSKMSIIEREGDLDLGDIVDGEVVSEDEPMYYVWNGEQLIPYGESGNV